MKLRPARKTVSVIGIEPSELRWLRMLTSLMRHPDPSIPELTRQALLYLTDAAGRRFAGTGAGLNHTSETVRRPSA